MAHLTAEDIYYAKHMLGFSKKKSRDLIIAITETASPEVKQLLTRQLLQAIDQHTKMFHYLYSRSLYPAYSMEQLIQRDFQLAQKALSTPMKL